MRIIKNLIAILSLAAIITLMISEVGIWFVVAMFLVGVWLYLDFAFDGRIDKTEYTDKEKEQIINAYRIAQNNVFGMTSVKFDHINKEDN